VSSLSRESTHPAALANAKANAAKRAGTKISATAITLVAVQEVDVPIAVTILVVALA